MGEDACFHLNGIKMPKCNLDISNVQHIKLQKLDLSNVADIKFNPNAKTVVINSMILCWKMI